MKQLLDKVFRYNRIRAQNEPYSQQLVTKFGDAVITDYSLKVSKKIRGIERKPAIIIHGTLQRTGTVYTGELLRLHPDIQAYPKEIWEVPFLKFTDTLKKFQSQFFKSYGQNTDKIGENDFLPLFGASFIDYLYSEIGEGKRMLLKVPSVAHLNHFYDVFPYENLLVLIRDGRDVVSSTLKSWPKMDFSEVTRQWKESAQMALAFDKHYQHRNGYIFSRYEDILNDPVGFVKQACEQFDLNPKTFPYQQIAQIPIRGSSTASMGSDGQVSWEPVKTNNFKSIGHWKNWPDSKKNMFKDMAGQLLIDLGYANDNDW